MIALRTVTSSALVAHGYEPASRTLAIRFHSGNVVHYLDVPQHIAQGLEKAESAGRYFSANIRGQFHHSLVAAEDHEGATPD